MRRKVIQDLANTLCQMLVGWRMREDLETLAALPDGELIVDALAGTARHEQAGPVTLHIGGELKAWLTERVGAQQIPIQGINSAQVTATIRTDRVATNRQQVVSFDFLVRSVIATEQCQYIGKLHEVHHWHSRAASQI